MGLFSRLFRRKAKPQPPPAPATRPATTGRSFTSSSAPATSRTSDDVLNPFNPVSPLNIMSHDDYAPTTRQSRSDSDSCSSLGWGSSSDSGSSYSSSDSGSSSGGSYD